MVTVLGLLFAGWAAAAPVAPPRRVISIAPSVTEEIFALGAEDRLIADTVYCNYPAAARAKPKIGSMLSPNLERIVALRPDLVVASEDGNRAQTVQQLQALGVHVVVFGEARAWRDIAAQFQQLGELLGRGEQARALLEKEQDTLSRLAHRLARVRPVRVFFEVGADPLVSANRATFIDDILSRAGGRNVEAASAVRYPFLSVESVLAANPEVILISTESSEDTNPAQAWARYPDLAARRRGRIFQVPAHLFSTPTPMTFTAAVGMAARLLHPETLARRPIGGCAPGAPVGRCPPVPEIWPTRDFLELSSAARARDLWGPQRTFGNAGAGRPRLADVPSFWDEGAR